MIREIKIEEVKQHNNEKSVWMIIHNEVYDVTKFLHEHPGGADSLLDYAGKDGTQAFEDVGHSDDAREMMEQYKIGTLPADQRNVEPGCTTQLNRDVLVLAATSDCGSVCRDSNQDQSKPWRTFDGTRSSNSGHTQLNRDVIVLAATSDCCGQPVEPRGSLCTVNSTQCPAFRATHSHSKIRKDADTARAERRLQSITVPRESSGWSSGSNLKWALLALAGALVIGVAMKKYLS